MSAGSEGDWAAEQAAFDPDGLYWALTRFLAVDRAGVEEGFLPYPPAAALLQGAGEATEAKDLTRAPGPRREAISLIERRPEGLVLYASDRLVVRQAGLTVTIGASDPQSITPTALGQAASGGLQRWLLPLRDEKLSAEDQVTVADGEATLFAGPAYLAAPLAPEVRVQFRRFSGDALWFGPTNDAQADAVTGPIVLALNGEAGSVWRWGLPTADKEGRALWRVSLDDLVRPGMVQDWELSLPDGGAVARGRFLTYADDKDPIWMRPPEQSDRIVTVTVVRDRPRQSAGLAILLVTRESFVLEGEPVKDPAGFAFRARDNSYSFLLPTGTEPAHISVRRQDQELFRLPAIAAKNAGAA